MELNKIYNENCLETMAKMPDGLIDLVVTSPPYDGLRKYNGYSFDFESVAKELFRVVKPGGVVVWVVGDATVNGSETGASFRQSLFFMGCGFRLHDTMIYKKENPMPQPKTKRYSQAFEYMFVLSNGEPLSFNQINKENAQYYQQWRNKGKSNRAKNGENRSKIAEWNKTSKIGNVWGFTLSRWSNEAQSNHPATFPEQLAADHIYSWSNEGDLVYDPFMGSGTTAKMAHLQNRKWIGSEISAEYVALAEKRLQPYISQGSLFTSYSCV